jgi:hypothetical protein
MSTPAYAQLPQGIPDAQLYLRSALHLSDLQYSGILSNFQSACTARQPVQANESSNKHKGMELTQVHWQEAHRTYFLKPRLHYHTPPD